MEPIEAQVISLETIIANVERIDDSYVLTIRDLWCKLFLSFDPNLRPGDQVRITITKEPPDAKLG